MNHFATEERIDFRNQLVPANWNLAMEKHLRKGCKCSAKTVSRWQRASRLFYIPAIRRSAGMGFLEKIVLSLKRDGLQRQATLSLLCLLIELAITLFIAGIVAPSLLRSGVATNEALAGGSLHTVNIAGVTLSYTYKNLGFAMLGALVGATTAFAIAFPPKSRSSKATAHHAVEMAGEGPARGKFNLG
jgi:hypothetical protein